MAKASDEKAMLLAGLQKVLSGRPMKQTGTGGIFTGKTAQALVDKALTLKYLEPCDGPPQPPKKSKKTTVPALYARITAEGRAWVEQQLQPRELLESLVSTFKAQSLSLQTEMSEGNTLQAQLANIDHSIRQMQSNLREIVARRGEETQALLKTIQSVSNTLNRLLIPATKSSPQEKESTSTASPSVLVPEIVTLVRNFRQTRGAGYPLPDLYRELRGRFSDLTIGHFHDLMRTMHRSSQIRLSGWSGTLDEIREPELALFVSNKVMYYADSPGQ